MDQAYVHLLVNHLPVFGSILGCLVLAHGLWTKTDETKMAAYYVLILSAIGATIAFLTGEAAEEKVEDIQGISKEMISQHEDFALIALISLCILGVISIIGVYVTSKKSSLSRTIAVIAVIISLVSFVLVARTGYLGGQIRHTEIHASSPVHGKAGGDVTISIAK